MSVNVRLTWTATTKTRHTACRTHFEPHCTKLNNQTQKTNNFYGDILAICLKYLNKTTVMADSGYLSFEIFVSCTFQHSPMFHWRPVKKVSRLPGAVLLHNQTKSPNGKRANQTHSLSLLLHGGKYASSAEIISGLSFLLSKNCYSVSSRTHPSHEQAR